MSLSQPLIALVIPSYNEGERLSGTLERLLEHLGQLKAGPLSKCAFLVVVIDDGSKDPVQVDKLPTSSAAQVFLLRHIINLGQGAALQTGIELALLKEADFFVTLDADGQHAHEQIADLLKPVMDGQTDVAFGNRFGAHEARNIPAMRKAMLKLAVAFETWLTGLKLQDAHNGFRAFNRKAARLFKFNQNRMAHATELKQLVAEYGLKHCEVAVTVQYTPESLAKGQKTSGLALILKDLAQQYFFFR